MDRKRFIKIVLTFLLIGIGLKGFAQTYPIADENFIKYLKKAYPKVLDSRDSLIISEAEKITSNIYCPDYSIKNFDGVQFFKNVPVLDIFRNRIATIPPLDSLKHLTQILAFNNELDTFPEIAPLQDLHRLYLGDNNLSYLPELNKNKKLTELHCHNNTLVSLPNVDSLINLKSFHFGNNPSLTNIPSFKKLTNLESVYFYQCSLSAFPDISHNLKLRRIYAGFNQYTSLPDFSIFPDLEVVEITYCNLTFEDLIPLTSYPGFDTIFLITPQNKVGVEKTVIKDELTHFTIDLNIDPAITTNVYKWYKDDQLVAVTTSPVLNIDTVRSDDAGKYTCEITNTTSKLKGLVLHSNPVNLIVNNPCLITQNLTYTKNDITCNGTGEVMIDTLSIHGGVKPYTYQLHNTFSGINFFSTEGKFRNLSDGEFKLIIRDKIGCIREISGIKLIRKTEKNSHDCKGIAITPDGDDINDTYYISEPGEAKIYNSKGQLVKKITTPAYWDGRDNHGQVVGDYYLIEINKEIVINITVIY